MNIFKLKYLFLISCSSSLINSHSNHSCHKTSLEKTQVREIQKNISLQINDLNQNRNQTYELAIDIQGVGRGLNITYNEKELKAKTGEKVHGASNLFKELHNLNQNKPLTKGKIRFIPGKEFHYEDKDYTIQTDGKGQLVGRKKGVFSMFSKKFPIEDFIGIKAFLSSELHLEKNNIKHIILPESSTSNIILFTNANTNLYNLCENFTMIRVELINGIWKIVGIIICVEGAWSLIELPNPIESFKQIRK